MEPLAWEALLTTLRAHPGRATTPTWQLMLELVATVDELATKLVRALDLAPTELRAIIALWHNGSITISELASTLHISTAASSLLTDRLEQRDLAQRVPHETDRRRVLVRLTPAAEQALIDTGTRIEHTTGLTPSPGLIGSITPNEPS